MLQFMDDVPYPIDSNGHDEDHVELVEDIEDRLDRFGRTHGEAGLASHLAQLAGQTHGGVGGTHVEGDGGGAELGVFGSRIFPSGFPSV